MREFADRRHLARNRRRVGFRYAVCFLGILAAATIASATTLVRSRDLPALVEESRSAVLAEVVAVRYAYDEHRLPSTFVTLRVEDSIYGDELPPPGDTLRVKLFGSPVAMPDGIRIHLDGTPGYRRGERYLLLLIGRSEWGFTNTAALMFGAFRVEPDAQDRLLARSLGGNRFAIGKDGLAGWLGEDPSPAERSAVADPTAPVPYSLLRRALTNLWIEGGGTPLAVPGPEAGR